MSARFPKFRPGMRQGDQSAIDLQHLTQAARASFNLSGTGVEIRQSLGSGTHVRVVPQRQRRVVPSDSNGFICAITVKPLDADKTLTIREVVYKDGSKGPIADTDRPYEFDGDPIEDALPFIGRMAKEYAGKELELPTPVAPPGVTPPIILKPGQTFFEAYRFGDTIILGDIVESVAVARFRVVRVPQGENDPSDIVIGQKFSGVGNSVPADADEVMIARPWELRRLPFHDQIYKGSKYTYSVSGDRETSRYRKLDIVAPVLQEREIVYPTYADGDQIWATKVGEDATGIRGVEWIDDNRAARRWARSTQQ